MTDTLLWSIPETARQLGGVSVRTVERLIADGELPTVKVRGSRRVPTAAVHQWLERQLQMCHTEGAGAGVEQEATCQDRTEAARASIDARLAVLGSAITWANARLGWQIHDPTRGRKPVQSEGRARWITRQEAERLLEAARQEPRAPWLADWIQAALYTGCRKQELPLATRILNVQVTRTTPAD